jgi:tetratricopeptide repeat protein
MVLLVFLALCGCGDKSDSGKKRDAYHRRGVRAYRRGEYEKAVKYFEKAIVFNPEDPDPYLAAAEIYDDYLDNKTLARERYSRYIALSDNDDLKAAALGWIGEDLTGDQGDTIIPTEEKIYKKSIEQLNKEKRDLKLKITSSSKRIDKLKKKLAEQEHRTKRYRLGRVALVVVPLGLVLQFLMIVHFRSKQRRRRTVFSDTIREIPVHIDGKYLIIEDGSGIGSVDFKPTAEKEIEVTCYNDKSDEISSGTGKLERDAIDVTLQGDTEQPTQARFEFHDHGATFTAAWRSPDGSSLAVGIKHHEHK